MNEESREQTNAEQSDSSLKSEAEAFEKIMGRPIPKIKLDD